METPATIQEVQQWVRSQARVRVTAGGTKPALAAGANLSLAGLAGVLEYDPSEFTFTALAGTRVADVQKRLAEEGQYLPFDPPWARSGATLGGTVAAGLSGPGRFRYGGVRDFILGVQLVTGDGQLVRGGGRVVKNVAGFDLPKLMVGSLGRYGVIVELCFKVFPAPEATATVRADLPDLASAVDAMTRLAAAPLDLDCLELEPPGRLWIRLAGRRAALPQRVERVRRRLGPARGRVELTGAEESAWWDDLRELAWVPEAHGLVKIPLVPDDVPRLESQLAPLAPPPARRYSVGGNLAWVAWPAEAPPARLAEILAELGRPGLALRGPWPRPQLGPTNGHPFDQRLRRVFDPSGRFQREGEGEAVR